MTHRFRQWSGIDGRRGWLEREVVIPRDAIIAKVGKQWVLVDIKTDICAGGDDKAITLLCDIEKGSKQLLKATWALLSSVMKTDDLASA